MKNAKFLSDWLYQLPLLYAEDLPAPLLFPETPSVVIEIPAEGRAKALKTRMDEDTATIRKSLAYFEKKAVTRSTTSTVEASAELKILSCDYLSTDLFLITWQGRSDRYYKIQSSPDLETWSNCGIFSVVNGTGQWSDRIKASQPRQFYRIAEHEEEATPATPHVGPISSFGGGSEGIAFEMEYREASTRVLAKVVMPEGREFAVVDVYVDGFRLTGMEETAPGSGLYFASIDHRLLSEGGHTVHIEADASIGTTPDETHVGPSSRVIMVRSMPGFLNTGRRPICDMRISEEEILMGEDELPAFTTLSFRYGEVDPPPGEDGEPGKFPPGSEFPFTIGIRDMEGHEVLRVHGTASLPGPGNIEFNWNGRGEGNVTLPPGKYQASVDLRGMTQEDFPQLVQLKDLKVRMLALGESLDVGGWDANKIAAYRPEWHDKLSSSGGSLVSGVAWGPWTSLKGGMEALVGGMQKAMRATPQGNIRFWIRGNKFNDAQPWTEKGTNPGLEFAQGNPFNKYEIGLLMGHGVASSGGAYPTTGGATKILPPQHYFPFVANPSNGGTLWIKSGQMAEKFGAPGSKLRWMCMATCNYLRVGNHNNGSHDIFDSMKTAGTLPFGPNLRILCGFTTSVDITGNFGKAFGDRLCGSLGDDNGNQHTIVNSWLLGSVNSENGRNQSYDNGVIGQTGTKQVRNARAVFWPECENDKLPVLPDSGPVPGSPAGGNQLLLEIKDSKDL